ncbi:MAG: hypothetical protein IT379_21850 [Deltaproteobacteria bacterium]|nr:hypothetical protein [Deltaproteobacteria bacterium]
MKSGGDGGPNDLLHTGDAPALQGTRSSQAHCESRPPLVDRVLPTRPANDGDDLARAALLAMM